MKRIIILFPLVFVLSCAHLIEQKRLQVENGMTKAEVIKLLGQPNSKTTSASGYGLFWKSEPLIDLPAFCVKFENDRVIASEPGLFTSECKP